LASEIERKESEEADIEQHGVTRGVTRLEDSDEDEQNINSMQVESEVRETSQNQETSQANETS